uniref:Prokineticin domain-containing protein n=1 Tax=Branchiostoma floridae TaxID=7739 RepID=C3YWN3_BRAFL|eukprot:XP_002599265.1 hypothetical protein BRAFLDRAFT_64386 [Branchiostoma floridae]
MPHCRTFRLLVVPVLLICCLSGVVGLWGLTVTGVCESNEVCESDRQCIQARGQKSCCAPLGLRDLFSGIPVCKPMGLRGDRCHIAGDYLPYPLDAPRRFWRCPCADGLSCLAPRGKPHGFRWAQPCHQTPSRLQNPRVTRAVTDGSRSYPKQACSLSEKATAVCRRLDSHDCRENSIERYHHRHEISLVTKDARPLPVGIDDQGALSRRFWSDR